MCQKEELSRRLSNRTEKYLGPQLGALLDSGRFADVVVRVGQEEIRAHSAILAARSAVFDAMWSSGMKEQQEKEVIIKDLEPTAVRRMLRFMYTGALDSKLKKDSDAIALLEAAHQYDVASLVEVCVSTLSSWLTEEKAADYLMIAEHTGLERFRQRCLDFITSSHRRVAEVQATEGFNRLTHSQPNLAVEILAKAIPPAKRARIEPSVPSPPVDAPVSAGTSSSGPYMTAVMPPPAAAPSPPGVPLMMWPRPAWQPAVFSGPRSWPFGAPSLVPSVVHTAGTAPFPPFHSG